MNAPGHKYLNEERLRRIAAERGWQLSEPGETPVVQVIHLPLAEEVKKGGGCLKERPILFSAPMVRAILEGRKTQTRRIVKHPEYFGCLTGDCPHWGWVECERDIASRFVPDCPYGKPGDRLWVKETFWTQDFTGRFVDMQGRNDNWVDSPSMSNARHRFIAYREVWGDKKPPECKSWKPSIFMPRWASRITLEITDVHVERLNDISEEDAKAEGCEPWAYGPDQPMTTGELGAASPYRGGYACLWDDINGGNASKTWYANPWVWVVSFKRVESMERAA